MEWIAQQPDEIRDTIADEFATDEEKTLDETLPLVFQVSDPKLRDRLLVAMFQRLGVSVDGAPPDLSQSSLSPSEKNHVADIVAQIAAAAAKNRAGED